MVNVDLERFGEIVRSAVRGLISAGGQQRVERLLGDPRDLVVVLTSHTPRPDGGHEEEVRCQPAHLSFLALGILSNLWGGDRVDGNLEVGAAEATGDTSAKAISKISEAIWTGGSAACDL